MTAASNGGRFSFGAPVNKPFLTIDKQVYLLERRGMATSPDTPEILMREGYYSVVNGYKDPFIDKSATEAARDDRYLAGSTFSDMYTLFCFDRSLREVTFKYLIRAEATARTAIAYCFSEFHPEPDAYLDQSNFASQEEYESRGRNGCPYRKELQTLISMMMRRAASSGTDSVTHYRESYGQVPLWVLANDLTFGNMEHFFNIMKDAEQAAVRRHIAKATGRLGDRQLGFFTVDKARVSLEALVKFRNICAHDERLYCARVGGRKNIGYAKMVWLLERFLTKEAFAEFLSDFASQCESLGATSEKVGHILYELGISEIGGELSRRNKSKPGQS